MLEKILGPALSLIDKLTRTRGQKVRDSIKDYLRGAIERRIKRKLEREKDQ